MGLQLKPLNSWANEFGGLVPSQQQQQAPVTVGDSVKVNAGVSPGGTAQAYGGATPATGTPAPNSYAASLQLPAPYAPGQYAPWNQQDFQNFNNNSGYGSLVNGLFQNLAAPLIQTTKTAVNIPWMAHAALVGNQAEKNAVMQSTFGTTNAAQAQEKNWGSTLATAATLGGGAFGPLASLGAKVGVGAGLGGAINAGTAMTQGANTNDVLGAGATGTMFGAGAGILGGVAEHLLNRGAPPTTEPAQPGPAQPSVPIPRPQLSPQDELAILRGEKPAPAGYTPPDRATVVQALKNEQANAPARPTVTLKSNEPAPAPVEVAPAVEQPPVNTGQQLPNPEQPVVRQTTSSPVQSDAAATVKGAETPQPTQAAPTNPYSVNGTGRPLTDDLNLLKTKLNNAKDPVRKAELQAEYNAKTEAATGVAGEAGPVGTGKTPNVAVRELGSKKTVLRKIGGSANELADRMEAIDNTTGDLRSTYRRATQGVLDLNKEEFTNLGNVIEKGAKPMNSRVAQAAAQHNAAFPAIHQDVVDRGIKVGNIQNYFPRDYSALKKGSTDYKAAINNLIKSGKASTPGEAEKLLQQLKRRGETSPNFFGSIDRSRESDTTKFTYTKNAYEKYLNGVARKVAEAHYLGPNGEISNELLGRVAQEGGDDVTARKALKNYLHDAGAGRGKTQSAVRGAFGVVRLGKAVISHAGQTSNVALVTRSSDLAKGLATRFTDENKQFIRDADVNNPDNLHGLVDQASSLHGVMSKVTAPGLTQMMQFNRGVSAIAGREYGNFLANRGTPKDIDELRSLTVTGPIGKTLTYDQQLQVARGVTNKTMFTSSRADTPLNAETPTGKTMWQYRLAYAYKQTGLVYKQVIKEAAKGNLKPLLKFLTISAGIAGSTVAIKNAIAGKPEDPKQIAIDSAAALGGIPGELLAQAGQYLAGNPLQTVAGMVAPAAGEAVKIGQAGVAAINGNLKPAERYVAGLVPYAGSWIAKAVAPVNEEGVKFYKDANALVGKYGGSNTKEGNQLQSFFTSDVDPKTGAKMQSSPADQFERNQALVNNDQMRHDYQKLMQSQKSHDPMWDLPDPQLKTYLGYEAHYATDPQKQLIFNGQTDANGKNWMGDLAQARSDFYNNLKPSGNGPPPEKNPQTPEYPKFSNDVTQLLNKYDAADAATKTALIKDPTTGPELSVAWAQKALYTNALAKAQNPTNIDLKPYPVADAATQAILNEYNSLPQHDGSKGGNATRYAWTQTHPAENAKMQDYLMQVTLHNIDTGAAKDIYVGTTPDSKLLGDMKNFGQYDITTTKAADGSNQYALIGNQNGGSTNSTAVGSGGGSKTAFKSYSSGSSSSGGKKGSIKAFGYAKGSQAVEAKTSKLRDGYLPRVKSTRTAAGVKKLKTGNTRLKPKVALKPTQ